MSELGSLPPGWDSKFDPRTRRYYFINHYTKTTSWEDPRIRYQQLGRSTSVPRSGKENKTSSSFASSYVPSEPTGDVTENIPLQDMSISNSVQGKPHSVLGSSHGVSPLPLSRLQLEETLSGNGGNLSPQSTRSSSFVRRESHHVLADISEVESSFQQADLAVQQVAAMFPTVEESHIRDLLKRYHGSQAVVISALQVAKHPLVTPGPNSMMMMMACPADPNSISGKNATLPLASYSTPGGATTGSLPYYYQPPMSSEYQTPRTNSAASGLVAADIGSPQIGPLNIVGSSSMVRSFPRPHSSPKMKLRSYFEINLVRIQLLDEQDAKQSSKIANCDAPLSDVNNCTTFKLEYLKSVFPTVEEYLLLDVLSNSDNNVSSGSDRLVKMGYVKRDTPNAPRLNARRKEEERLAEKRTPLPKPPPLMTEEEKADLRVKMCQKYETKFDIPQRILFMALESVLYDEEQAKNLIQAMIEDDIKRKRAKEATEKEQRRKSPKPVRKAIVETPASPRPELKKKVVSPTHGKKVGIKVPLVKPTPPKIDTSSGRACGPNPNNRKGPNDGLLLTDYIAWNGANPSLRKGPNASLVRGPNLSLRNLKGTSPNRVCSALGPNCRLRKGPVIGRAKGSIYVSNLISAK